MNMDKKQLIVYGGAFNPPTAAHLSAIRALADYAREAKIILLPSGAPFIRKWKPGQDVLPDAARVDLMEQMIQAEGFSNVLVDLSAIPENLCTFDALNLLKKKYDAEEALFVIGEDKLPELPRWAHAEELAAATRFILLNYEKSGEEILSLPGLSTPVRLFWLRLPKGTEKTHASDFRKRMLRHDPALLQEDAGKYLSAHPECLKIAATSPRVHLGNPEKNAEEIIAAMEDTDADLLVFPELSICGATCGDMLFSPAFLRACEHAAQRVARATAGTGQIVFFGCPVQKDGAIYNCAAVASQGNIIALIPKSHLSLDRSNLQSRWFTPADTQTRIIFFAGNDIPLGVHLQVQSGPARIAAQIGQDALAPLSPGMMHCRDGANILLHLDSAPAAAESNREKEQLFQVQSRQGCCVIASANCGVGESTGEFVYTGERMIYQQGKLLSSAVQPCFSADNAALCAQVDLSMIESERLQSRAFIPREGIIQLVPCHQATFRLPKASAKNPFMPFDEPEKIQSRCLSMLDLQARSLCQRIQSIGLKKVVIGISGGLDSTLALIVTHTAFKALNLPAEGVIAITMPGEATSSRTLKNATDLCRQLGTTFRQIPIGKACALHGDDIGHDPEKLDITYENIQARERTQILMDVANMENAIVIGTGDLSELGLGWCTYNGDHISHYGVNSSVPKTLVQHIVRTWANSMAQPDTKETLLSILDTEITPELVPGGASTEARIGQYALHDFFLYYFMRYGFEREKLRLLAADAFGAHMLPEINKTLSIFFSRYFASQFKRSCLPDGARVGEIGVSPRGDLLLPSDGGNNYFKNS